MSRIQTWGLQKNPLQCTKHLDWVLGQHPVCWEGQGEAEREEKMFLYTWGSIRVLLLSIKCLITCGFPIGAFSKLYKGTSFGINNDESSWSSHDLCHQWFLMNSLYACNTDCVSAFYELQGKMTMSWDTLKAALYQVKPLVCLAQYC